MYGVNRDWVDVRPGRRARGLRHLGVAPPDPQQAAVRTPRPRETKPIVLIDVGALPWGSADPEDGDFDDRHLIDADGEVVEVRIPWAMLTFADPSSRRVFGVDGRRAGSPTETVERIGISLVRDGEVTETAGFAWEDWNAVTWHERRKGGWETIQKAFRETAEADSP